MPNDYSLAYSNCPICQTTSQKYKDDDFTVIENYEN